MKLKKIIVLVGMIFGCMSVSNAFSDLDENHWAYEKVKLMSEQGVITGYTDGTFRPEEEVTREEFATILTKTLGLKSNGGVVDFKDIEDDRWSKDYIDAASPYLTGYISNGNYYFNPELPAVREDMAVAVVKAKGLENKTPDYSVLDRFSDEDKISPNLRKYIALAVEYGIMSGNANGTFNPTGNLTRAEITALMSNVSDKVVIGDEEVNKLPEFKLKAGTDKIIIGEDWNKYQVAYSDDVSDFNRESSWKDFSTKSSDWYRGASPFFSVENGMGTLYVQTAIGDKTNEPNYFAIRDKENVKAKQVIQVREIAEIEELEDDNGNVIGVKVGEDFENYKYDIYYSRGENAKEYRFRNREFYSDELILPYEAKLWIHKESQNGLLDSKDIRIECEPEAEMISIPDFEVDVVAGVIDLGENHHRYKYSFSTSREPSTWYNGANNQFIFSESIVGSYANYVIIEEKGEEDNRQVIKVSSYVPESIYSKIKFNDETNKVTINDDYTEYEYYIVDEDSDTINWSNVRRKSMTLEPGESVVIRKKATEDKFASDSKRIDVPLEEEDFADTRYQEAVNDVVELGIMYLYEDGNFNVNEIVTRAQMARIVCKMIGINESVAEANMGVPSRFSDVPVNEWYAGWVNSLDNNGLLIGFPDEDEFRPSDAITLNEALTFMVNALGRGGYVTEMGTWPANYVTEAARLNLLKDVKGASDINRGTLAIIIHNTLDVPTWQLSSGSIDGEDVLDKNKTLRELYFSEDKDEVEKYEVSVIADGAYIDGDGMYCAGDKVKITLKPKDGYEFLRIQRVSNIGVNNIKITSDGNNTILSFTMPAKDGEIEVLFTQMECVCGGSHEELRRYKYLDDKEHTEELYCGKCDEVLSNAISGYHNFVNGKCVCGAIEKNIDKTAPTITSIPVSGSTLIVGERVRVVVQDNESKVVKVIYRLNNETEKTLTPNVNKVNISTNGLNTVGTNKLEVTAENEAGLITTKTFVYYIEDEIVYGDIDEDGDVTPKDRMILNRYLAGWDGYEEQVNMENADVFVDGTVDAMDGVVLSLHIANWDIAFPHECKKYSVNYEMVSTNKHKAVYRCRCADIAYSSEEEHKLENGKCICGFEEKEEIKYGDVNSDGVVNGTDRRLLEKYFTDKKKYEEDVNMKNADVFIDGIIDVMDVAVLSLYTEDEDIEFPHECKDYSKEYEVVSNSNHEIIYECNCGEISYSEWEGHKLENGKCVCGFVEEANGSAPTITSNPENGSTLIVGERVKIVIQDNENKISKVTYSWNNAQEKVLTPNVNKYTMSLERFSNAGTYNLRVYAENTNGEKITKDFVFYVE